MLLSFSGLLILSKTVKSQKQNQTKLSSKTKFLKISIKYCNFFFILNKVTLLLFKEILWLPFTMTYKKLNANKERATISLLD